MAVLPPPITMGVVVGVDLVQMLSSTEVKAVVLAVAQPLTPTPATTSAEARVAMHMADPEVVQMIVAAATVAAVAVGVVAQVIAVLAVLAVAGDVL